MKVQCHLETVKFWEERDETSRELISVRIRVSYPRTITSRTWRSFSSFPDPALCRFRCTTVQSFSDGAAASTSRRGVDPDPTSSHTVFVRATSSQNHVVKFVNRPTASLLILWTPCPPCLSHPDEIAPSSLTWSSSSAAAVAGIMNVSSLGSDLDRDGSSRVESVMIVRRRRRRRRRR